MKPMHFAMALLSAAMFFILAAPFRLFWKTGRSNWKKKTTAVPIKIHCQRISAALSTTSLVPFSSS